MTLQVPLEEFAATVKRLLEHQEAFVAPHGAGSLATAGGAKGYVVATLSKDPVEKVSSTLKAAGMKVFEGTWSTSEVASEAAVVPFVASVAYKSAEERPGLWVDAYESLPTQMQVLKAMYDEFRATEELEDVAFEEFVRLANPNVVICSPSELQSFVDQKADC